MLGKSGPSCIAGVLAALIMLACQPVGAADRMRIGFSKGYAPAVVVVVVAKEDGFFQRNGIEAELMTFGGGGASGEALAAGAIDIGAVPIFALALAVKRGLDARMVAQNSQTASSYYILVSPDSPIKDVKDLDGKKIGITAAGSTTDAYARYLASKYGVNLVTVAVGPAGLQALERKQIDAMVGYPPNGDLARLNKSARVLLDLKDEIPANADDLWAATGSTIRDRPDVIRRTLAAVYGATAKLQSDRAYAVKALKSFMGSSMTDELATVIYKKLIMEMSTDGAINPEAVIMTVKLLPSTGVDLAAVATPEEIYVKDFTPVKPPKL